MAYLQAREGQDEEGGEGCKVVKYLNVFLPQKSHFENRNLAQQRLKELMINAKKCKTEKIDCT